MTFNDFRKEQIKLQKEWKQKQNDISKENGWYNKKQAEHIIPESEWIMTIWKPLRQKLANYLRDENLDKHTGAHDLLSSWVLCSNLYFGTFINEDFKELFRQFIEKKISIKIEKIDTIYLEFVPSERSKPNLLGEPGGIKQTTPDVAIIFSSSKEKGLILVECKYTESSFYNCFGRKEKDNSGKIVNPNPKNCDEIATIENNCLFNNSKKWIRKYWNYLKISKDGLKKLKKCPACTGGYQLVRQQSLAEGIIKCGNYEYENVWSCVAYDRRNEKLMKSMKRVGINSVKNEWRKLFDIKTKFIVWEHQEWVEYVRENGKGEFENNWISYINERYNM
jgi:hypothetical protein